MLQIQLLSGKKICYLGERGREGGRWNLKKNMFFSEKSGKKIITKVQEPYGVHFLQVLNALTCCPIAVFFKCLKFEESFPKTSDATKEDSFALCFEK